MSMKLTVNAAGFNNSVHMGTKDGQSVRTVKNAAFGGATKLGEDPVAKRREEARRQAWKVVENAWKNDRSVDDTIQSHRDSYAELENRKKGALAAIDKTNRQKETLREQIPRSSRICSFWKKNRIIRTAFWMKG